MYRDIELRTLDGERLDRSAHSGQDAASNRWHVRCDAGHYDLLNRLLSAGLDRTWRTRTVESLGLCRGSSVLDLCTGTADLALALAASDAVTRVIGVDFAAGMLRHGQDKTRRAEHGVCVQLLRADAMQIPVGDAQVDATTIGFGIRNVIGPEQALREVYRVLRPGGRLQSWSWDILVRGRCGRPTCGTSGRYFL